MFVIKLCIAKKKILFHVKRYIQVHDICLKKDNIIYIYINYKINFDIYLNFINIKVKIHLIFFKIFYKHDLLFIYIVCLVDNNGKKRGVRG